jgi:type II secretory pathway component GspD/PulD (secretin)
MLARESKQSIIVADQSKLNSKVTAILRDLPLETALKDVVESVGCSWHRDATGAYVISSAPAAPVQAAQPAIPAVDASANAAARAVQAVESRRTSGVDTIKLYNTNPVDMMWLLGLYDIQHASQAGKPFVRQDVSDFHPGPNPATITPGVAPGQSTPPLTESLRDDSAAGRTVSETGEAMQFGGGGGNFGGGYRPSGGGTTGGGPGGAAPGAAGGAGGGTGSKLLPSGIDFVMPYELDNSLIVRGDEDGRAELKEIIQKLDIAPKQIMIKAEFVEIDTDDESSLGIDWQLTNLGASFANQFGTTGNVTLGYANGNVIATLKAELTQNHGKVVNGPIISTLNNVPATIQIGKQVPFWTSTTTYDSRGNPISSNTVNFLPIQTQLVVLPRVNNADNSITCMIQPQVSDEGQVQTGPDGTQIPTTNQESLQTTRRVANGETIVLGGIIKKNDSTSVSKIPLLGDLPIVGPLFSSTTKSVVDTDLLIFLTPTIIPDKPVAGTGIGITP